MRIVIVGGGIVAVYTANRLVNELAISEVLILSRESYAPYDRIHLCSLVNESSSIEDISLELDSRVSLELNQEVVSIEPNEGRVFTKSESYSCDKLIIATGSKPRELFNIEGIKNAATFRSAKDSFKIKEGIKGKSVLISGAGPIGLELLDTLSKMDNIEKIYLISRGEHLYSKALDITALKLIQNIFKQDERIEFLFNDTIVDTTIEGENIVEARTRKATIKNLFLIFGVGIIPNIEFARGSLECNMGVLVDDNMQTSQESIYAIGEAAELKSSGFVAGHVKEATEQANAAISHILGTKEQSYRRGVSIDALKVGAFLLSDVTSPTFNLKSSENELIQIVSPKDSRVDQYIVNGDKLVKFIGINSNIDPMKLVDLIDKEESINAGYFYENRLIGERGRLVCSCKGGYELDLIDTIKENAITEFSEFKSISDVGRVCGRCKQDIVKLINNTEVDEEEAKRLRERRKRKEREEELEKVQQRIDKFNSLHPANMISNENLSEAIDGFELNREYNQWISAVTSNMNLHPEFEPSVKMGVEQLNKIPIIWLELSDCSGNSEGFIKSTNPSVEDLILNYISLDYHELLMATSGDESESVLNTVIEQDRGEYILMVEGAIPLKMDGKFLRIGSKGETGEALLKRVAKGAKVIIAIGSCAYDGGVVAAEPNPTGAVGVSEALRRKDIVNLPGCPVNPINIVGTLLHYIMFNELPKLDDKNRPIWAYGQRIHDNCERRGHYELDEFVLEWGDEGAKKGWCLFKMGCKGPYADLNCSLAKFNKGASWPVQAGHGCFACGEGKVAFNSYANHRELPQESKDGQK